MQSLCCFPTDYILIISHLTVFVKRIYEKILKIFLRKYHCTSNGHFLIFLIHYAPYSKNWKIRQYHSGAQQIVTGGSMSTTFIL